MRRFIWLSFVCCFAAGCAKGAFQLSGPEKVNLPFRYNFDKGELFLIIEAIPNRSDAVRISASDGSSAPSKVWVQEGSGSVKLSWEHATYHIDIGAFTAQDRIVTQVELGIRAKYNFN